MSPDLIDHLLQSNARMHARALSTAIEIYRRDSVEIEQSAETKMLIAQLALMRAYLKGTPWPAIAFLSMTC